MNGSTMISTIINYNELTMHKGPTVPEQVAKSEAGELLAALLLNCTTDGNSFPTLNYN